MALTAGPLNKINTRVLWPNTKIRTGSDGKLIYPKLSKSSPFLMAASTTRDDALLRSYAGLTDEVMACLMRSRGTRAGIPTPVAAALLQGVRGKVKFNSITGSQADMGLLAYLCMFHRIPCVPGKKKAYYKTSLAGIQLMEYWVSTDKAFKKFYDAYVSVKDVDRIKTWAATQAMGLEIDLIEETEKLAKIAQDEIDARDNLYAQMQNQSKYSYGQLTHSSLSGVLTF